jgi:hypothetical protein
MSTPAEDEIGSAAARFVAAFEEVFHHDWEYTKDQLGIDEDEQDRGSAELLQIFGEEPAPPRDREATFLDPRRDLDGENWGNYQSLLDAYARLKRALAGRDRG